MFTTFQTGCCLIYVNDYIVQYAIYWDLRRINPAKRSQVVPEEAHTNKSGEYQTIEYSERYGFSVEKLSVIPECSLEISSSKAEL
jgi:hypothetical protein